MLILNSLCADNYLSTSTCTDIHKYILWFFIIQISASFISLMSGTSSCIWELLRLHAQLYYL